MGGRPNVAAAVALRNRAWAYTCDAERLRAAGNTDDAAFYEAIANELKQVAHDLAPSGAAHIHAGGYAVDVRREEAPASVAAAWHAEVERVERERDALAAECERLRLIAGAYQVATVRAEQAEAALRGDDA